MKNILILIYFSFIVFGISSQTLEKLINLSQDKKILQKNNEYYIINLKPFVINIKDIKKEESIYIYALHDKSFHSSVKIGMDFENLSFFSPGTGVAISVNPQDKSIPLYLNDEYSHNHVTEDRRIRINNNTEIRINEIGDTYGKVSETKKIYLMIFVDKNSNKKIDMDEFAFINLMIKNDDSVSDQTNRAYISTLGTTIKTVDNVFFKSGKFQIVKITSLQDSEKITNKISEVVNLFVRNGDFNTEICYILFSPLGENFELEQPYHFFNDKKLIFEAVKITDPKRISDNRVSIRIYWVKKNDDIFIKVIKKGNEIIMPENFDL